MKKDSPTPPIKKRHIVVIAVTFGLFISLGGYLYNSVESSHLRSNNERDLKAIANSKIDQLTQWRKERIANARVNSQSFSLVHGMEGWLAHRANPTLKELFRNRLLQPQKEYGFEDICVASPDGTLLMSLDSATKHLDTAVTSIIHSKGQSEDVTLSDFYYCPTHNKIHYDIIAPVRDEKQHTTAVLVFRIDPSAYIYPLIQSWPTPSKTSETLLLRRDGDSVLYLNELRFQKNSALHLRKPLTEKTLPAVQAALGFEGIFDGLDYQGTRVFAYIAPVPSTSWFLVAKMEQSEMFSEQNYRLMIFCLLVIFPKFFFLLE